MKSYQNKDAEQQRHESQKRTSRLFFGEKEYRLFQSLGRELTENFVGSSVLLYIVDKENTQSNFYGEAKVKKIKNVYELVGLVNVETVEDEMYNETTFVKRGIGKLTFYVYLEQLEENGLIEYQDNNNVVFLYKLGDFIKYRGQVFEIINDGYSQLGNRHFFAADYRYYVKIEAIEVDENVL